jgi:hypothetical protein
VPKTQAPNVRSMKSTALERPTIVAPIPRKLFELFFRFISFQFELLKE